MIGTIDGFKQVEIVDSFPFVGRKQRSCCRGCSGRGRHDREHCFRRFRSDLILFQGGREAAGVSRPGDLADGEREAFSHGSGSRDDDHLVRLENCTHTPYLAYHCRRKLVGSSAQATNLMVTQDTNKSFIQVLPPCGHNTYVLRLIVLLCVESNCLTGVPCLSLYSLEGKVTDLETNLSRLQLP